MKYTLYSPQAIHEIGRRKNQEDSIYPACGQATAASRLFLVCDGMGGHERGEVASQMACKILAERLEPVLSSGQPLADKVLFEAVEAVYDALDAATPVDSQRPMGTTMALVALHKGGLTAAHLGDSRICHLRPGTREVLYRSRDHSLVQQLYEKGELTYEQMRTSPKRNVITRALLPHLEVRHRPDVVHITDLQADDWLLLCSDGMLEQLDDQDLLDILADSTTGDAQKRLRLEQLTQGNADNHSAYLIRLKAVDPEVVPTEEAPKAVAATQTRSHGLLYGLLLLLMAIAVGVAVWWFVAPPAATALPLAPKADTVAPKKVTEFVVPEERASDYTPRYESPKGKGR